MPARKIRAGDFKQHCLRLMDEVANQRTPLVITKRGKPVAKLVPADEPIESSYGALRGTVHEQGDILAPIGVDWEADA